MISKLPWKILEYTSKATNEKVKVTSRMLSLRYTLVNGQAFIWHPLVNEEEKLNDIMSQKPNEIYHGILKKYYLQFTTDDNGYVNYRAIPDDENLNTLLHDYFQFDYDYEELIKEWVKCDKQFQEVVQTFRGLRILRQDPFECLIQFICSQNNNIARITKLITAICEKYGEFILEDNGKKYYSFPSLAHLKKVNEKTLRDMGFGYRAKYITECVKMIEEKGGEEWLQSLRGKEYKVIMKELTSLMGIGKKVADCIALFSLDCKNAIPVDTHVYQIYFKKYKKGESKALTDKLYYEISGFFQDKFGEYAGWAHSYLFTADLAKFKGEKGTEKVIEKVLEESDGEGSGNRKRKTYDSKEDKIEKDKKVKKTTEKKASDKKKNVEKKNKK